MEFHIREYVEGQRPDVTLPTYDMYNILGEEGIRALVNDHYDLLASSKIKDMFPKDEAGLRRAKKHSGDFFVQVCGGPMYFNKNRGRPMMFKRHLPHKITPAARKVWLDCYIQVIQKHNLPENLASSFWKYLNDFSVWMVNTGEMEKEASGRTQPFQGLAQSDR